MTACEPGAVQGRPRVELSVVVPVYRSANVLVQLCDRIDAAVAGVVSSHEIILIDDASPDGDWLVIDRLATTRQNVIGLQMSRNFGQQAAIAAGYAEAVGEWTAVMDCDLQDPPEFLPRFLKHARDGADVVLGRRSTKAQSLSRQILARTYMAIANVIREQRQDGANSSYTLVSERARASYVRMMDRDRHHLFLLGWIGFPTTHLDYDRDPRFEGRSSYTFTKLVQQAATGLFLQTTKLLQWIVMLGLLTSAAGFLFAVWLLWQYLTRSVPPGFTSLLLAQLLLGGAILSSIGVVGLYVGRIFEQVKARPLYIVQHRSGGTSSARGHPVGFDASDASPPARDGFSRDTEGTRNPSEGTGKRPSRPPTPEGDDPSADALQATPPVPRRHPHV